MGYVLRTVRGFQNDLANSMDVRKNARAWFNAMGLQAEAMAKENAPVLTGFLRSTINWGMVGTDLRGGGPMQGRLRIGAVYGRRQEWEHKSRSFYAYRAVLAVAQQIEGTLQSDAPSVWLGVGRGWKGTWSWNPMFSEGGPEGKPSRFKVIGYKGRAGRSRAERSRRFGKANAQNRAYTYAMSRHKRFTTVASARVRRR